MCKVLATEPKLKPSLTREHKKINYCPGQPEGIFSYRGLKLLHSLCLQRKPRTAQTAVMMTVLTRKHGWNEDELGTQLVHAVFAEKS